MDKFLCALPTKKRKVASVASSAPSSIMSKKRGDNEASSQMYLDFGQRSFGATKTCAQCDMHYLIGDVDDERRHSSFCRSKATISKCVSVQHATVLKNFRTLMTYNEDTPEESMIVEVRSQQRAGGQFHFIDELLGVVSLELGTAVDFFDGSESLLLYFQNRKVLGCIVVESVPRISLVRLASGQTAADVLQAVSVGNEENSSGNSNVCQLTKQAEDNKGRTLGVKLVWVNEAHRRKSIAARLLDTARRSFSFGSIVKKTGNQLSNGSKYAHLYLSPLDHTVL